MVSSQGLGTKWGHSPFEGNTLTCAARTKENHEKPALQQKFLNRDSNIIPCEYKSGVCVLPWYKPTQFEEFKVSSMPRACCWYSVMFQTK
jgi:hypothetical protein